MAGKRNLNLRPRNLLPALLLMPLALAEHAQAACTPEPPANNSLATCTGTTTNQTGTDGYGTVALSSNSISVVSGASVTGTDNGIVFQTGNITNAGSISGANGRGVFVSGSAGVTNLGVISGGQTGAVITNGLLNNIGTGVITGGNTGVFFQDGGLVATNPASVLNEGVISGSDFGVRFQEQNSALGGIVQNSGTISATGSNGIAISAVTTATVTNESAGVITGQINGIFAGSAHVDNSGMIQGLTGAAILGDTVDVTNSGAITSTTAVAIAGADGDAKVINSGTITGRAAAVSTAALADVTNSATGLMQATSVPGQSAFTISGFDVSLRNAGTVQSSGSANLNNAVNAVNNATVENSGSILASGAGSAGIVALSGTADVKNAGLIQQQGDGGAGIVGGEIAKVNNSGSIQALGANGIAIFSPGVAGAGSADVTNSGTIDASNVGGVAIFSGIIGGNNGSVVSVNNLSAGIISADTQAIVSNTGAAEVSNAGTIRTSGDRSVAINTSTSATVINSGNIQSTGANSAAIFANGLVTVTNSLSGLILATKVGIGSVLDAVDVTNVGTITATAADGQAVQAATTATIRNVSTGVIAGGANGIVSSTGTVNVSNAGLIEATSASGIAISGLTANVDNAGTIQAGAVGISASTATVTNFGLGVIAGDIAAISAGNAFVENVGRIQSVSAGRAAIEVQTTATVANSGTILATDSSSTGISAATANVTNSGTVSGGLNAIFATTAANVTNSGAISGQTGIIALGNGNVGSTITNSGKIAGNGGTAIKLSPAADTLTLLPGSQIIGAIDMGGGADTINILNTVPVLSRVSSFFRLLSANLLNIINFTGTLNTAAVTVDTGGMPAVQTADGIATLDPTAFGQADRTLMDFTGGVSSLVQGRLGGTAANVSAMQVVSFAPTSASGRTNEAFAAISALAYGPQDGAAVAGGRAWSPADSPYNVWASGFGGARGQKGDNLMLRTTSSAWGAAIGVDRQVRSDLLVGAFVSSGTGQLSTELNSQSIDTDYFGGGIYGRFDWSRYFLDFTVQAGVNHNKSRRLVLNSLAPGGSENAIASYNGWYVSPEVAFGVRYALDHGYALTPVVRLRYLAGAFDEYSETGSVQNLSVGRRTLHDLEERAEIELSKITGVATGALRTSVHGGLIALQRIGTPTINTVMIGQNLSFTAPGKDSAAGFVGGVGFDLRAAQNVSLFGAFETTVMSDRSRTAAAKGGLRVMF
jgi:uncharacterized protein with beta-barrel porin domain